MIVGASKTGKSMLLSELAIAIAEGTPWLGRLCAKGRVLYVNLEIPEDTFWNRIIDIYEALGLTAGSNLTVWNLRGYATQMDKLTPKLIRRARKINPEVVIIDPIYKVLTGDENSAEQMARFCNEFDKLCTQLGASTIYCHHHSKGAQGGKNSMDRASGSGVFARDADALLDLTQLNLTEAIITQEKNKAAAAALLELLKRNAPMDWQELASQDDRCSRCQMETICRGRITDQAAIDRTIDEAEAAVDGMVAIRAEATLREFPRFKPVNIWFKYPLHYMDEIGTLKDLQADNAQQPSWQKALNSRRTPEQKQMDFNLQLENAFENLRGENNSVPMTDLMKALNLSARVLAGKIDKHGGFIMSTRTENGRVARI